MSQYDINQFVIDERKNIKMRLNKGVKLVLVCIVCVGLITGIVLLIEFLTNK